jgi:hypothetical protein
MIGRSRLFRATPQRNPKGWHLVISQAEAVGRSIASQPIGSLERYGLSRNVYMDSQSEIHSQMKGELDRHCCVAPSLTRSGHDHLNPPRGSDGSCEVVEGDAEPVAGGDVGGDVVVAAAQVLHERVADSEDPR